MGATGKSFLLFQESRRADLRRIARRTRGDFTEDDAGSEAWLIALKIERKRGFAIDFANRDDQELILSWLHRELVDFPEKHIRFAVKLDDDWDSDDSESSVSRLERLLATPEEIDPLFLMDALETDNLLDLVNHSYSQAAAYAILLHRFDWKLKALAEHLRFVVSTIRNRVAASCSHVKHQPSLFDRIQTVENDFTPTISRGFTRTKALCAGSQQQFAWDFI